MKLQSVERPIRDGLNLKTVCILHLELKRGFEPPDFVSEDASEDDIYYSGVLKQQT